MRTATHRRSQHGPKTDERILQAATDLFYEKGYAAVSIDAIGQACGVSGPAIYRHFRSKAEILLSLCMLAVDRLIELVGPVREDAEEELEALIQGHARFAVRHPELVMVVAVEQRALDEAGLRLFKLRQRDQLQRWQNALARNMPFADPLQVEFTTQSITAMMLSVPRWPRNLRSSPPLDAWLADLARVMIGFAARSRKVNGY